MAIHYNWPREWIQTLKTIPLSPELQALDLKKCRDFGWDSLTYWLSYHVITQDEHDHEHPFAPLPFLYKPWMWEVAWMWFNEHKLFIKKSRQMMVTWLILACELWNVQYSRGQRIAIQSKKEEDADNLLQRMWTIYEHQPIWLKQEGADAVFCELRFPQMQSVVMGVAQGPHQLRQYTFSRIFSDELGFQDNAKDAYGASKPTVDGGGYYTAVSSAIPGFFEDMWNDDVEVLEPETAAEAELQRNFEQENPYEGFIIPTRRNRTGILAAGFLHYSMDPDKDPSTPRGAQWVAEAKRGDTKGNWNQEMEGDAGALSGEKVYPTWDESVHLVEPFVIPEDWTRIHTVDPGLANPCGMLWIAIDPENNWWVYREFYKKEMSIRGKDQLASIVRILEGKEKIDLRVLGHDAFARRADDKRCQHDTWNEEGFYFRQANRDRASGIGLVKELLRFIPELGKVSGNPKLRVFNTCIKFRWEIGKWKRKKQTEQTEGKKNPAEDPEEKDDHLMDALRMAAQEKPVYIVRQAIHEVELERG